MDRLSLRAGRLALSQCSFVNAGAGRLFTGRVYRTSRCLAMRTAEKGDAVSVHYVGTLDDGSQFDSSKSRGEPLSFVVGTGAVIPGFDEAIRGLSPGDTKTVRIDAANAYGEVKEELVVSIPKDRLPEGFKPAVGQRVPLSNGVTAKVLEVDERGIRIDANHELAGKALTFDLELVGFEEKILAQPVQGLERAIFALGCFWGAELAFQRVPGVVSTKVGYFNGNVENPTYEQVCSGSTGHTEAVAVDFDPSQVSYSSLLDLFWERLGSSALTLNQAGNDVGTQYRSGIYFRSEEQKNQAEKSVADMNAKLGKMVVTEVVSGEEAPFYLAENYHQRYLEKGGQSAEKNATETIRCYG